MLSFTLFTPNTTTTLFQQTSHFNFQPPPPPTAPKSSKPKSPSRTISNNCISSRLFRCFSFNNDNSSSTSDFHSPATNTAVFEGTHDPDSFNAPLASQFVDSSLLGRWLRSCYRVNDVRRIHAVISKCLDGPRLYVDNNLISGYVKLGKLVEARKLFDVMSERNIVSWTAMINGYFNYGLNDEGLRLFLDCIKSGVRANGKTYVCILNLCSRRLDFELGRQIHACIIKGKWRNLIVDSALLYFYAQCSELASAFCVFDRMVRQDVVCWTTMITACSQQGCEKEAFQMFSQMLNKGFLPNEFTVNAVVKACGEEKTLQTGRQLHGAIVKKICKNDVYIGTSLVDMYAKCGEIVDSRKVFNRMKNRNTITWTSIIAGYAREGLGGEAISLFRVMKRRKVTSNNLTNVSVLKACGSARALLTGKEIHVQIIKNCIKLNEYLGSTLVWFYCKCGESRIASKVLQQMPLKDVVSWTAIISGYAFLGHELEALEFLREMREEGVEPNSFTYSSALKACANLEALLQGKLIHSFANKSPSLSNVFVGSALIHMYAKCGFVSDAIQVFDGMPERNLVSWRAMIMGYVRNGLCQEALKLLYRMEEEGFPVNDYIYAAVLGSCGDIGGGTKPSSKSFLQSS